MESLLIQLHSELAVVIAASFLAARRAADVDPMRVG